MELALSKTGLALACESRVSPPPENIICWVPHKDFPALVQVLRQNQGHRVLDLGCGSGRHVIALAQEGFEVFGIDTSERAIQMTQQWLNKEKLQADLKTGDIFTKLPYPDDFFDGVISTKALNHALMSHIQAAIEELGRVCRNGET